MTFEERFAENEESLANIYRKVGRSFLENHPEIANGDDAQLQIMKANVSREGLDAGDQASLENLVASSKYL